MTMPLEGQGPSAAETPDPTAGRLPMTRGSGAVLALMGVIAIAWGIYRPDVRRPFDFVDFPETLLILQQHDSFVSQVAGLTTSLLAHARLNLFVYLLIAAKWSVFGWWTPGWQLARFATMSTAVVLTYALLRRLRISVAGALAGATIYVVAPAAVRGWIRLTSAEPVVVMFVLLAALLATYYQTSRRKVAIGAGLAVIGVVVVMTKEVVVVAYALPLYLLLTTRSTGLLSYPRIDRTNRAVLAAVVGALVVALIPGIWVFLNAPVASYGHWFGTARPSVFDLLAMTIAGLVPFLPGGSALGMLVVNAGYWGLLLAGLPLTVQSGTERQHAGWLLILAIGLPLLGGVVYLPWPNFQLVYAVPFLFGEAILIGVAMTYLQKHGKTATRVAGTAWCLVLAYAIPEAVTEARRVEAIQFSTSQLLPRVAQERDVDSVFVAAPQEVLDQRGLFGPRLFMYAQATQQPWPSTKDVSCPEAERAGSSSPRVVVVWSTFMCGPSPLAGETIRSVYPRWDWKSLRLVNDSMRFDILRAK